MNLCDDGHEEVCYECRHCPVCEIIKDNKDYVERLTQDNEDLRRDLADVETELTRYAEIFNEVKSAYPEFAI